MASCNKAKSYETICSCNECESMSCFGVHKNSKTRNSITCTCPTCENMNTTCQYYKKLREDTTNICALRRLLNEVVQRLPHPGSRCTNLEEPPPSSIFEYVGNAIKKTMSFNKPKQVNANNAIPVVKEQDIILCNICDQNRDECPCFYYDNKVSNLLDDLHRYLYSVRVKNSEELRRPCAIRNRIYDSEIREIVKKYLIKQLEKAKNCCRSEDRPTHVEIHPKTIDLITKQICSFKSPEESTCGSKKCSFHDLKVKKEIDKCQTPIINDQERKVCPVLNKLTPSRCKMEAKLSQTKSLNENECKNASQPTSSGRKCADCCQSDTKPKHTSTCPVNKEINNSLKCQEELKDGSRTEPKAEVKRSKYVKDGVLTEIVKTERAYKIINGKKVKDKTGGDNDKEKERDKEYIIQTCGLISAPEPANSPYTQFSKTVSCTNISTNKNSEVNVIANNNGPHRGCNNNPSLFIISRNEICDCDPCESEYCCKNKTSKNLLNDFFGSEINGFFNKPLLWQPKSDSQCNKPCQCNACSSKSMPKQNYIIGRVEQDPHCHCSACHCMDCTQSTPFSGHIRTSEIRSNRETQEMSTSFHSNRNANCYCDSCNNRLCEQEGNDTCSCGRQKDGVMRKPVTKDTNEYDIRHAIINEIDQKSWFRNSTKQQDTIAMYASLPMQNSVVRMEPQNNGYNDLIDSAALRISTIEYLLGINKTPCHTETSLSVNPCNCKPCDCLQCQRHYKERHIPQINFLDGFCDICECINMHSNFKKYLCDPKNTCNCMPCDCAECKKFTDFMKYRNEEDAIRKPTFFHKEHIQNQPYAIELHSTDSEIYIDYLLRKLNDNCKEGTPEKNQLQEYSNICDEIKYDRDTKTKYTNTAIKKTGKALGTSTSMITMTVNQSSSVPQITPKKMFRDSFCNSSGHDYYKYIHKTPKYQLDNVLSCRINKYNAPNFLAASNNFYDDVPVLKKKSIECLQHDINQIFTGKECCGGYSNQGECDYHPSKCNKSYTGNQYNKCRCDCSTCECSNVHQSAFIKKTEPTQTLLKSHQNRGENTIDHMSSIYSVETNKLIYDYFSPTEDFTKKDRNVYDKPNEFDIKVASDFKDTNNKSVERTLEESQELSKELIKMLEKYKQANKDFDLIKSKYNCNPTAENEKNEISIDEGSLRKTEEQQDMSGQKGTEKLETVNTAEVIVKIEAACDRVESKPESKKLFYDLSSRSSKILELKRKFRKFSADLDMAIGNCERNKWRKVNISNTLTPKQPNDKKKLSNTELNTVYTCVTKDVGSNESPVKDTKSSKQQENCEEDESMTNLIEETSLLLEKSKNSLKKLRANYVAKSGVTTDQPNLPLSPSKGFHDMMSGKRIQKSFNYDDSLEEMYKRKFVSLPAMNLRTWIHERQELPPVLTFQSVSKISDHTIMVKWQTPKNMTNVLGYELLIDDRPVQKILSPKRRIAIITCLPHSEKVRLTLRSIISRDNCVPMDGPTASYMYYPKPYNKYRRSRSNFLHKNCGLYQEKEDLDIEDTMDQIGLPLCPKPNQSAHSHISGQPSQQVSHQLSYQPSHQHSHQPSHQLSGQYSRQLSHPSYHSHQSHRSHHSDISHHTFNGFI